MAGPAPKDMTVFGLKLWQQIALAITLAIVTGMVLKEDAAPLAELGVVFIKLIKMVVAPLIFFALISGITSLTSAHHFKKIAIKGTAAYLTTAFMAVAMGLLMGEIFQPGVGVPPPPGAEGAEAITPPGFMDFLNHLIPENIIRAMSQDHYLQIVIFAIFTGIVMNNISGNVEKVKELVQEVTHIVFKMIEWVVALAPIAVFGFIAAMVGTTGVEVILSLLELVALVVAACASQMIFFGLLIVVFAKLSPWPFFRKLFPTQLMAFSTSSSKATLTTAMRELQDKMGVSVPTSNFMMPLGASINMDGTAIYLGICATFFAQMYGIELGMEDYLVLMVSCTIGSIGAAGIPSGSILFMGMVLTSVGIPMEGIALILGVDRILDMFRTTTNITGDSAITLIIDKTEGEMDKEAYYR